MHLHSKDQLVNGIYKNDQFVQKKKKQTHK